MDTDSVRLKKAIKWLIGNGFIGEQQDLANILGYNKTYISGLVNGKIELSSKFRQKFTNAFPQINNEWIANGRGSMIIKNETIGLMTDDEIAAQDKEVTDGKCSVYTALPQAEYRSEGIPLIPLNAMAGVASGEFQIMEYECERYVVPAFKGAEFLISVSGDSMTPKYNSGDLVACKILPLNDLFFQWNKAYVLDTRQGALIKRVKRGCDDNHVLIVSDNPAYEPFELHKSRINSVAIVVGVIRLE